MKVTVIIPARLDSTRFPNKLIEKIGYKPIIIHVYDNVKKSNLVDDVIVATDSDIIFDICEKYGAKCVMTGEYHTSGTSRIIEVAKKIQTDIVVNVQGDEPLITKDIINSLIKAFEESSVDIVTLKSKIEDKKFIEDKNVVKVVCDKDNYAMYFSRATIPYQRDENENVPIYYKHIGVYAFRHKKLLEIEKLDECEYENIEKLEQIRWLYNKMKIKVIETNNLIHGIDTKSDLEYVKNIMIDY